MILLAGLLALPPLAAQTLTRGPYLQMAAPDAITLRWQTDEASDSRVQFGDSPTTLTLTAGDATEAIEHDVRLTGLTPNTTYYYSVGTSAGTLAGGDATFKFTTAPLPGTIRPVRIWVLGDSGTGGDGSGRAESVRDGYLNSPLYQDPDLWLMLGDNAYNTGTEDETTRAIFQTYPTMLRKCPLWSTFGNHESYTLQGAPYFNAFTLPKSGECGGRNSGTEHYYAFDYANIHFVCLDSESTGSAATAMLDWLELDLASTTRQWLVAFWHQPPYSKGSHDSDTEAGLIQMRANALPILERNGVDLVLCGHSHCYERSMLLDGHYGDSSTFDPLTMAKDSGNGGESGAGATGAYQKTAGPHHGAVYVVAGNSGKISGGALNHPVMITSKNQLGSLLLDVNGNRLEVRELGSDGAVFDHFTLLKEPQVPQLAVLGWLSIGHHAGVARALPIPDGPFVEPRLGGLRRVEIRFAEPLVVSDPTAAVTVTGVNASGAISLAALGITTRATADGSSLVVEFSSGGESCPLPDAAKWRFTLNPAAFQGTSGAILPVTSANTRLLTSLAGDTTGNGRCSGIDLNRIATSGPFHPLASETFRADLTGDGVIDTADQQAAWANRQHRTDTLAAP